MSTDDKLAAWIEQRSATLAAQRPPFAEFADNDEILKKIALLEVVRQTDIQSMDSYFEGRPAWDGRRAPVIGYQRALSFLIDHKIERCPLIPRRREVVAWADSFLTACGELAEIEALRDLAGTGVFEIAHSERSFTFRCVVDPTIEQVERANQDWFRERIREHDSSRMTELALDNVIAGEMRSHVDVDDDGRIRYASSDVIDDYFMERGTLLARQCLQHDAFGSEAKFGGLRFDDFVTAVGVLIGFLHLHMEFVRALCAKNPSVLGGDQITITADVARLVDSLSRAMGVEEGDARTFLRAMTLSPKRARPHLFVRSSYPMFIDVGGGQVIKSVSGALTEPFNFLLQSLLNDHRADWFRNVNDREPVFRAELYRLFESLAPGRFRFSTGGIKMKKNGKETSDIDAAVLDTRTGDLALFQLKWSDVFALDAARRDSAKRNLDDKTTSWFVAVNEWLASHDAHAACFGVPAHDFSTQATSHLFVVGRNFVHFAGSHKDTSVAWGTWLQLLRVSAEVSHDVSAAAAPLRALAERLRSEYKGVTSVEIARHEIVIDNVNFRVEPG